jgi:hypothetical protein
LTHLLTKATSWPTRCDDDGFLAPLRCEVIGSTSKTVRNYRKTHRTAANKEISEALVKQGVEVSPNHVANINAKTRPKAAVALLKECHGSMTEAKAALAAAQEIRALW